MEEWPRRRPSCSKLRALSEDPVRRVERALAAAEASVSAGAFRQALSLLPAAGAEPLDDLQQAREALLRAQVAFTRGLGREAPFLLHQAARRFEPLDLEVARETYLLAWAAAVFAGRLAEGGDLLEISRAVRSLPPPPDRPRPVHLLLDGLAVLVTDGRAAAVPLLQRAAQALTGIPLDDVLRWGPTATAASDALWDHEGTRAIAARHLELLREAGALAHLQLPLAALGNAHIWSGDFAGAASLLGQAEALAAATGSDIPAQDRSPAPRAPGQGHRGPRPHRSQVLVMRGEPGIGKTALLDFLVERSIGCRIARASGVESEMELPFASLHQLCGPYLARLDALPPGQRDALSTAFGLRSGTAPDIVRVGLAALTLLAEVAEERPLVWLIDDAQWLDQASAAAIEFVARRLKAEPIAVVLAARPSPDGATLAGLPELLVRGVAPEDAAELLDGAVPGPLDPRVRDRILAESHGNPLALLELPRAVTPAELTFGGAADAGVTLLAQRLEQGFVRQVTMLPRQSRRLLLLAAAEPVGDVPLLRDAAGRLGISPDAATAAEARGLLELGDRARFRHPLVRSAIYRSATPPERREVHRALADATDAAADADRRAWHLAHSAVGPDESVAAELERAADRAVAHGGLAAAAACLHQAAALTPDPVQHVRRSLDADQAKVQAGGFDDALALLATAEAGPVDEFGRARAELLDERAAIAERSGSRTGERAHPCRTPR